MADRESQRTALNLHAKVFGEHKLVIHDAYSLIRSNMTWKNQQEGTERQDERRERSASPWRFRCSRRHTEVRPQNRTTPIVKRRRMADELSED